METESGKAVYRSATRS